MDHVDINSTMIKSAGYEEATSVLEIAFNRGGLYHYLDVPKELFQEFLASSSKGRFFDKNIKDKFKTQKIK